MVSISRGKMPGAALAGLWAAIAAQTVWIAAQIARQHAHLGSLLYALLVTLGFAAFACTRGRSRWIATVLRMFVSAAFLSSVCDRFGLFGGPATPGVSWGDFANFVAYTGQVNSFLPAGVVPALAVIETVVEGALGLAMLVGAGLRMTLWASVALLCSFALAMSISLGARSPFPYAVHVLAAGTWLLATADASLLSVDAALLRIRRKRILA